MDRKVRYLVVNNYTYSVVQNTCQINYAVIGKTINFGDN